MKQVILFVLLAMAWTTSHAQFKDLNGSVSNNSSGDYHMVVPSNVKISDTKRHTYPYTPLQMSTVGLSLEKDEAISNFIYDDNGELIAGSFVLNYQRRQLTSPESKAKAILDILSPEFKINKEAAGIEVLYKDMDELGIHHIKVGQLHNGIPVFGMEMTLHGKDGNYDFFTARWGAISNNDVEPSINVSQSQSRLLDAIGPIYEGEDKLGIFNINPIVTDLVYYLKEGQYVLAYHHTVYKDLIHRWEYFTDAHDGSIIKKYENICKFHHDHDVSENHDCSSHMHQSADNEFVHTSNAAIMDGPQKATATDLLNQQREIDTYQVGSRYYMIDASREMFSNSSNMPNDPVGTIWTVDAFNTSPVNSNSFDYDHVKSNNNAWGDKSSVSAHYNGAKAYLYFKNLHLRNSINGSGGNIVSFVNVADEDGRSMDNAFWNGAAMFYGNGASGFKPLAAGLDVAGHEMSHGVVQNTANLVYQNESGAMNESFADIFGAMIDRDDWLIGEDVVKISSFPSGALRSLIDPHNGAPTGDYGAGWQPKKYSERYQGSQDNGGVHINSGIPNHAFYLFATDTRLGSNDNDRKFKAEKVFYRALSQYLTKSSKFVDLRVAVERSAKELYGDAVAAAANEAFNKVEIPGGSGGGYQNDAEVNPGQDLVLVTTEDKNNLYVLTAAGDFVFNPLTDADPFNKPSITDAGDVIVFVDTDKNMRYITIDWNTNTREVQTLNTGGTKWRNCAISKDGRLIAALTEDINNEVFVFDLGNNGVGQKYELKNPTFSTGVATGDVVGADILEFDYTNEYIMYDAQNIISSQTAGEIEYWDIGFIKVWNDDAKTFALPDQISKLFQGLPEGVSVGNPTFSKNSNYIIAFDFIDESDDVILYGANIETGELGVIFDNEGLSYPSFSKADDKVIFDFETSTGYDIGEQSLQGNKIQGNGQAFLLLEGARWGVWFSNGVRDFTSVIDQNVEALQFVIAPNPVADQLHIDFIAQHSGTCNIKVLDIRGASVMDNYKPYQSGQNSISIPVNNLSQGTYFIQTIIDDKVVNQMFVKQ